MAQLMLLNKHLNSSSGSKVIIYKCQECETITVCYIRSYKMACILKWRYFVSFQIVIVSAQL